MRNNRFKLLLLFIGLVAIAGTTFVSCKDDNEVSKNTGTSSIQKSNILNSNIFAKYISADHRFVYVDDIELLKSNIEKSLKQEGFNVVVEDISIYDPYPLNANIEAVISTSYFNVTDGYSVLTGITVTKLYDDNGDVLYVSDKYSKPEVTCTSKNCGTGRKFSRNPQGHVDGCTPCETSNGECKQALGPGKTLWDKFIELLKALGPHINIG